MFDAPPQKKARIEFALDLDLETEPWNIGLVVGPSGSGKTSIMRHVWGEPVALEWSAAGVVDDFSKDLSVAQITDACSAVGFNTIPAWMRPFAVLSNGEKFRVDLARRLLEGTDPIVVDEFTSVVDRQVAQIGSHAVQKYIRKHGRRFVAVGCHYDVIDWLQPDWILDMATRQFTRRLLQRRPSIECVVGRLPRASWTMFAPFHYLTADIHRAAKCFGLWASGRLASFAAIIPCPVSTGRRAGESVWRVSRAVTLPDWQGIGLAHVLLEELGAEHAAFGRRLRHYPAHPGYVRQIARRPHVWRMVKPPGRYSTSTSTSTSSKYRATGTMGGRPCAVFEYCGPPATNPTLGIA